MTKNNFPIYLSLAIVFGILIGVFINGNNAGFSLNSNTKNEAKIRRLMDYIDQNYVDTINTTNLLDSAISEMIGKLDPHSAYIPKEDLQDIQDRMQGKFVGIGIQFRLINDSVTVIEPIKGGPSIKAGIRAGDRIIIADKDTLSGKNLNANDVPIFLKGTSGSDVTLQVYRKTNDSLFNLRVTRGDVNIKSVGLSYMINDHIGYIKLDRFARNTYREFTTALTKLTTLGMDDLVLDLRGNGGGFIDIANSIVDEFLEDDALIVFTKNNKGQIEEYFATKDGAFEKGKLYVLIDENSASASEIVAGALQDNDKGTIIGRRSFGKGLVQVEMGLGDGSAVRLTTARYYTPTGRSIQKPYAKNGDINYYKDYQKRILSGELLYKDSIQVTDSLRYETPAGKVVYGGGGIIPDVFVGIDTTGYLSNFYFRSISNFSFDYVDENRKELSKNWPLDLFLESFDKDDTVFQSYVSTINTINNASFKTKEKIRSYIKATIAREIFGDEGFYRSIQKDDAMLQKVLELDASIE
ncbi:S41 family peptidase [Flavobacteriaceae bacterium]|nr:S41 family peptidase [Flavobacteriaceae bacterium]